ncbi:Vacuolar-sorting protein SNF8 [Papilio machaon]|uniref:Vacuolar-sorting protein SNF8 n=1 Tax=Papilio machaon TaxID=76193 RepID=A0A0N1IEE0_PAPMA|nr:Vacuolar-sorting protein SNF8 [Papilio machaon]
MDIRNLQMSCLPLIDREGDTQREYFLFICIPSSVISASPSHSFLTRKRWNETRAQNALNHMVKEGLAWIDTQDTTETLYWFPSMFAECVSA